MLCVCPLRPRFGCIPVMLASSRYGGSEVPMALPLQEHPGIDWARFAVVVHLHDLPLLPQILANVSAHARMRKRAALAKVWRRMLYTGIYGSYLVRAALRAQRAVRCVADDADVASSHHDTHRARTPPRTRLRASWTCCGSAWRPCRRCPRTMRPDAA